MAVIPGAPAVKPMPPRVAVETEMTVFVAVATETWVTRAQEVTNLMISVLALLDKENILRYCFTSCF